MNGKYLAAGLVVLLVAAVAVPVGIVLAMVSFFATMNQQAAQQSQGCDVLGQDVVVSSSGPARVPVVGKFVYTSAFGQRFHPIHQVWRLHAGMDLATTPVGGQVVAAKAGKVVTVVHGDPGAGNFVEIDHGEGVKTRYFHLASISAKKGSTVTAGEKVGIEGSTGSSTAPHLHFEVHQGGSATDPVAWLKKQGVQMPDVDGTGTGPAAGAGGKGQGPSGDVEVVGAKSSADGAKGVASPVGATRGIGQWNAEQVRVAAEIIRAAKARKLDKWTTTVGVMTAMGESTLRELDYGDDVGPDSRGPFQQRTNWGPESKRKDAYSSALLFFDALVKVKGYRNLSPTIAAHRTQGNADANHYAKSWPAAVNLVAKITEDPDLAASLAKGAGDDVGCDGADVEQAIADMPGKPGATCKATSSPAEKGLQSSALRGLRCTKTSFTWIQTMHGVGERDGPSDHGSGNAVDFMIPNYASTAGNERGWQVAQWTRKHAKELGVTYVIWDKKIWSVQRDEEGWREYTRYAPTAGATLLHRDHVHVSFS